MGYDTYISIYAEPEVDTDELAATMEEVTGDDAGVWAKVIEAGDNLRWYDHISDMKKVSVRYPGVLFTLKGDGEDSDDEWVAYHRDGKVQIERRDEWTPPSFNPDMLV